MTSRFRLPATGLGAILSFLVVVLLARPTAADARPGLYAPTDGRAAADIAYLYMHETTSLQANGDGEERIEFLVTNTGSGPVNSTGFIFRVNTTQYWGIKAWDDAGDLQYSISIEDDEIYITIHFRRGLATGESYRYYFAITFPDLARQTSGQWRLAWTTTFPVTSFVRTVVLMEPI